MLSLYPPTSSLPSERDSPNPPASQRPQISELGNLRDAVASFTKLTVDSGATYVRLHCTVPTWSYSTDACLDLHDLNDLRSRFLIFIHDLIQSLRSSGISAAYYLAPSSSSLCLVSQKPIDTSLVENLDIPDRTLKRDQAALINLDGVPCLIIT